MQFMQAANFTRVDPARPRTIEVIVIHTMEAAEKGDTAEAVARYFQRPDVKASAHYNIDADSIVQCVADRHVAWAAPGCNHNGLQLEHAGTARQTAADWSDPYSREMLERSAALAARLAKEYRLPLLWLSPTDLRLGRRGFTTHADVTKAFPGPGRTHWDPGPNFPKARYLELVKSHLKQPAPSNRRVMPAEFWVWAEWRLGEGRFSAVGPRSADHRPETLPIKIPDAWWRRLEELLAARK